MFEVDHVTVAVAFEGVMVAVSVAVSPKLRFRVVGLRVMPVTATSLDVTVTRQVADLPPALAMIVAVPSATALTVPLLTVATDDFELDQVTVLFVALSGLTFAVKLAELPMVSDSVVKRVFIDGNEIL